MSHRGMPHKQRSYRGGVPDGDFLFKITEEELATGLNYPDLEWNYPVGNVLRYGADPRGLYPSDTRQAIQRAIEVMYVERALDSSLPGYTWYNHLKGGDVYLPRGYYVIDQKLFGRDRVSLVGDGGNASYIVATTGMTDTSMLHYVDGTNSMFECRIESLRLSASNNANITSVVRAEGWQEQCGLIHAGISAYQDVGLLLEQGYGGAARCYIVDTDFGGFSNVSAAIQMASTLPNSFMLGLKQSTITSSGVAGAGVLVENGRLDAEDIHFENVTNGINFTGGNGLVRNLTGASDVVSLVAVQSGFNGVVDANGLDVNGGTNSLDDGVTSRDIVGSCDGFHFPFSPQSGSTTPSVAQKPAVVRTFYNGTPTTITDFIGGPHEFILRTQDANTTIDINGNANINRADGVNTDYTEAAAWFHVWDDRGTWIIDLIN